MTTAPSDTDDPFAEFEDWLKDGPAGAWPIGDKAELSQRQGRIVSRNVKDLLQRDGWHDKIQRFEAALASYGAFGDAEKKRAEYEVRFDRCDFADSAALFTGYRFPCSVSFIGARFGRVVFFDSAEFATGDVTFALASFGPLVDFELGQIRFDLARFGKGRVDFSGAKFGVRDVLFSLVDFGQGEVLFDGADFSKVGYLGFGCARFASARVSFQSTRFGTTDVSFDQADIKHSYLLFSSLKLEGRLFCNGLEALRADFSSTQIDGITDWTDAEFGTIPDLRNIKLDRPPEVARTSIPAPKLTGFWPWSKAKNHSDVSKLRKLKAMAIAANDHEKDGEFFAYEMMAKRGTETKGLALWANWFYWIFSGYGRSYLIPLTWIVGSFVGFAGYYAWSLQRFVALPDATSFAWSFSLKNALPFVGSLFRFAPVPQGHTSRFEAVFAEAAQAGLDVDRIVHVGIAQSAFGLLFLFFLLLGLRNKFRLK